MERLRETRTGGVSSGTLRAFGMFFLAGGIIGRAVLQRQLLGVGAVSTEQLLEAMQSSQVAFFLATTALILQAMETCAIPIFGLLLVEGMTHTSSLRSYALRIAGAALLSEIPYNLAMSGSVVDLSTRNPMFGLLLALATLYIYRYFGEKSAKNTAIKAVVTVAALLWPLMLNVEYGIGTVAAVLVLWTFRGKPLLRNLFGIAVMAACSLFSPFLLASSMGFLAVHFYNGERGGSDNRWLNYLFYPVLLLLVGLAGVIVA